MMSEAWGGVGGVFKYYKVHNEWQQWQQIWKQQQWLPSLNQYYVPIPIQKRTSQVGSGVVGSDGSFYGFVEK